MQFQIAGLILGLGALAYLLLVVTRLSRTVRTLEQRLAPAPAPLSAPAAGVPSAPVAVALDESIVAVIAAAVASVIRHPHRIVAVQPESSAQRAWSAEGRREIYLSHRVR